MFVIQQPTPTQMQYLLLALDCCRQDQTQMDNQSELHCTVKKEKTLMHIHSMIFLPTKCIDLVLEICVMTVGSLGGFNISSSSSSCSNVQTAAGE